MEWLYILLLIIQILFAGFILFLLIAFMTGGPFVPSSGRTVSAMVKAASIRRGMTVYDVGSGDGRILMAAAALGANAVGIEINPYLVWYTRLRAFLSPYRDKIRVIWGDLWKTDLTGADRVFVYLIPWRMQELAAKMERELPKDARIITNSFIFPGWKSVSRDPKHHVYTFRIPTK